MWIIAKNGRAAVHAAAFGMSISPPWKIWGDTAGSEGYTIGAYETKDEALYVLDTLLAALREGKVLVDSSEIIYGTDPEQASEIEP